MADRNGGTKPRKTPKIIQPGDPDYDRLVGTVTDEDVEVLQESALQTVHGDDIFIPFKRMALRQGTLEYGVIEIAPDVCKLIFHFEKVSRNFANQVGEFFWKKVRRKIITDSDIDAGASMEAGENPIFRSNWDMTILNISALVAQAKLNLIIDGLRKEFPV
jgi:hypothetical protein